MLPDKVLADAGFDLYCAEYADEFERHGGSFGAGANINAAVTRLPDSEYIPIMREYVAELENFSLTCDLASPQECIGRRQANRNGAHVPHDRTCDLQARVNRRRETISSEISNTPKLCTGIRRCR